MWAYDMGYVSGSLELEVRLGCGIWVGKSEVRSVNSHISPLASRPTSRKP